MALSIALICEGPTDQAVLRRLLTGALGDVVVNEVQPPRPMGVGDFGGWEQVFATIADGDVGRALEFNDLVLLQIDTDVCERPGFDVPRRIGDRERTEAELVEAVRQRLLRAVRDADPEVAPSQLLLAVCVEELECWLFLLLAESARTTGCSEALNKALAKANRRSLSKDPRRYEEEANPLRRKKAVNGLRGRSFSLDQLLGQLDALTIAPPTTPKQR